MQPPGLLGWSPVPRTNNKPTFDMVLRHRPQRNNTSTVHQRYTGYMGYTRHKGRTGQTMCMQPQIMQLDGPFN